jgi:hypothetical protein
MVNAYMKDRFGRPERGGSEWEPIKILPFGWIRPIPHSQLHEPTHTNKTPNRAQTTSKEPPRSLGTRSGSKQTRTEAQALNCKSLGGLSVWDRRTVREGVADRPDTTRGLSEKALRTNRAAPWKIGLSVIEPRTVRTENLLADRPQTTCKTEIKIQSIERRTREELDELAKNNPGRGQSATSLRTVRPSPRNENASSTKTTPTYNRWIS